MNNSTKASRATVMLGNIETEGYLLPEHLWTELNKFGVSKTQAVILAYPSFDRDNASSKYLQIVRSKVSQSISPKGFQVHAKIKTDAGKGDAVKVDLLPVDQLILFLKVCKKLGSVVAEELIDDLAGLSLQQLFSDAFDIKFGEEQRQQWLKSRAKSKEAFWSLGDAVKSYKESHSEKSDNYRTFIYSNCQNAVNRGLFGKDAATIRKELGIKDTELLRDHYGEAALRRLDLIQSLASANIVHRDIEPLQAVKESLAMYNFEVIDYRD
jgi:hypothetical protein